MRSHIISSRRHLTEGQTYVAACGEEVPNAVWVYQFNTDLNKEFLAVLSQEKTCPQCFRAELADGYIYGMTSLEEFFMSRVQIKRGLFERYYLFKFDDDRQAWSGSQWVPCANGLATGDAQVCNFETLEEAVAYVNANGLFTP